MMAARTGDQPSCHLARPAGALQVSGESRTDMTAARPGNGAEPPPQAKLVAGWEGGRESRETLLLLRQLTENNYLSVTGGV